MAGKQGLKGLWRMAAFHFVLYNPVQGGDEGGIRNPLATDEGAGESKVERPLGLGEK